MLSMDIIIHWEVVVWIVRIAELEIFGLSLGDKGIIL